MWNYISVNHEAATVASSTEGIKRVLEGNYAFLIEYVYWLSSVFTTTSFI
jgi:hypothetical protein